MDKKKIVTSYEKITPEIKQLIMEKYTDGWKDHVKRVNKPDGTFFHAISVDTKEISYLIKVQVKIDSKSDLEKETSDEKINFKDDDSDDGNDSTSDDEPDESSWD
ncbi:MAG: hypothetical protein R2764_17905 [Bacteroidales bacterium]